MTRAELLRAIERAHFRTVLHELETETLTYAPEPESEEEECPRKS